MRISSWWAIMAMLASAWAVCAGCASVPADGQSEGVATLQLLFGEGDDRIDGYLPEEGTLRVYWFWSSESQCSKRAEPGIAALKKAHPDLELIVVHSNADESQRAGRQVAVERELAAPLYRDSQARWADEFDARMTPEVVVVNAEGVIYQGRPLRFDGDDIESFVEAAVEAWKAGENVDPEYRRPSGCLIRRP